MTGLEMNCIVNVMQIIYMDVVFVIMNIIINYFLQNIIPPPQKKTYPEMWRFRCLR